jgi:hypothetical protein
LNAEAFFLGGAFFAGTGDLAVEHIADAGCQKTAEGVEGVTCRGEIDAYGGNEQTYVCQNNRIIVKAEHGGLLVVSEMPM